MQTLNGAKNDQNERKKKVGDQTKKEEEKHTRLNTLQKKKNSGGIKKKRRTRACDTHSHISVCDLSVVLTLLREKTTQKLCYSLLIIQKTFFAFKIEEEEEEEEQ